MNIHLVRTRGFESSVLRRIWEILVLQEGPLKFHLAERPLLFEKNDFDWKDLFKKVEEYRNELTIPENEFIIVITELSNSRNWFSSTDESGKNNIFIHGQGWENFIYCDPLYPIAYEVIANTIDRFLFKGPFDLEHAHEPAIGCMNDMCSWKPDITLKLRTGDICSDCLQWARDSGLPDDMISQALRIFGLLRPKMLHSAPLQADFDFDQHLPFNVAITKRKISSTGEPLRKFLFLIDHFDSLIRTALLFWAAHIFKSREESVTYFSEKGLSSRPSLGTWLSTLQDLTKRYRTGIQFNDSINKKVQRIVSIAEQSEIVSKRNEMRGHGYTQCSDSGYREVFSELLPSVQQIEDLLSPLFSANKLRYINLSSLEGDGLFRISYLELSGSYAVYTEKSNSVLTDGISGIPIRGRVYIFNTHENKWYEVSPNILFENCPACNHQRLLIYDSEELYLDPLEGHRVKLN